MAQHALDAVEPRLAHPGGQAADGGLRDAADAVVRVPRGENLAADRLTRRRIECGEGGLAQRGDVRGGVGKGTVPRFTAAENVCTDRDAGGAQHRQHNRARRDERRGDAAGEVSAAAPVLKAVVLTVGGVVRVRGARKTVGIVAAAGVFVGNDDGERRPGGASLPDAAENLIVVWLAAGGCPSPSRGGGGPVGGAGIPRRPADPARARRAQHRRRGRGSRRTG